MPEPESFIIAPIPCRCAGGYEEPILCGTLSEWIGPSLLEITEASVMHSNGSAGLLLDMAIGSPLVILGKRDIGYVFGISNSRMSCS